MCESVIGICSSDCESESASDRLIGRATEGLSDGAIQRLKDTWPQLTAFINVDLLGYVDTLSSVSAQIFKAKCCFFGGGGRGVRTECSTVS